MRWAGHVAQIEGTRNAYKILARKSVVRRPLGRSRCRWEDNIKKRSYRNNVENCGLDSTGSGWDQ
jgi:hypothetical protein